MAKERGRKVIRSYSVERLSGLVIDSENEGLASLDDEHSSSLASSALQLDGNLLCGLSFFPEDGLGLTSKSFLFRIISSLSLSDERSFACLVLGDLVDDVLVAFLATGSHLLGEMDLRISRRKLPFCLFRNLYLIQ